MRAFFISLILAAAIGCSPEVTEDEDVPPATPEATVTPPTASGGDSVDIDLGMIDTNTDVAFDVPAHALGFNITVQSIGAGPVVDGEIGIETITDPKGTVVHDGFRPAGGSTATSISLYRDVAAAGVPQNDATPAEGRWTFRARYADRPSLNGKLHAHVLVQQTDDGLFHGGTLDLHVHVPKELTVLAAGVLQPLPRGEIERRVDRFFEIWTTLTGIARGKVTYYEASPELARLDGVPSTVFTLPGMQAVETGLQVLVSAAHEDSSGYKLRGVAAGIPGPANRYGTTESGVVVFIGSDEEGDARDMVHEAGHFFGLAHTTEDDGTGHSDPLSDTPVCPSLPHGATREVGMKCPDMANLMFASGALAEPTITKQQLRVIQGSPIYRAKRR